ncbi:MAG: hypothetical protein IJT60_08295 [Clostridia bacterium]|nr:hypothetical protein [Clostridia bacterium]
METIHYPVKGRKLETSVTEETLNLLLGRFKEWQQGPGVFGLLNLHSCWSESRVLDHRYQGETVHQFIEWGAFFRRMYESNKDERYRVLVNSMAAHLLYLQDPSGGFIHCTAEFEPSFNTSGCPIHWFSPVIALLEYYAWPYADPVIKSLIPDAVERQWNWAQSFAWKRGNGRFHPLSHPGWCGVTNQDLTAVSALALTGKVLGIWDRYEQYGKPALDYMLSPANYYEKIGLFERGDGVNFAERTVYYIHILTPLKRIFSCTGDERIPGVIDNVASHLFDAAFVHEDGFTYLARGAITDPEDKSYVKGWEYHSIAFQGYPTLIAFMEDHLRKSPDPKKAEILESLKETVAGYIFADGNIPCSVFNPNGLFQVVVTLPNGGWLEMVQNILGDRIKNCHPVAAPCIHRTCGEFTYKQNGPMWALEKGGDRLYGGYSRFAGNMVHGPDEKPIWSDFSALEPCQVKETM